ncbi:MAG: glycerol-3-phosphate 1-O-acyltransferase PlsY [Burkholderiales bacterium]|jgi:glycerol-3-phosphate acyltransferase PlsY|nr:glycerol-3-phosphate 1-O-acyltransferase PlsY [Burkholderiales bacterium]
MWAGIVLTILAYLLGSVSFARVVSRAMKLPDPKTYGSGNPGATNVLRTGNKKAAALTFLGDFLKGLVAVLIGAAAVTYCPLVWEETLPAMALSVFLGHLFPIFHGFKGGKGVATAGGVVIGVAPILGVVVIAVWAIVALGLKISSAGALSAALALIVGACVVFGATPMGVALVLIALISIWRHRANIARLFRGAEDKIQ